MLGLLRRLVRLRGPLGVVALAVGVGLLTGLVTAHLVLAAWVYRDAARRDLREPRQWALAVLVGGLVSFSMYVAVQGATDWSNESRALGVVRRASRLAERARGDGDPAGQAGAVEAADGAAAEGDTAETGGVPVDVATPDGRSLAATAARYGLRATRRGARWAAGRARERVRG